jgi:hypothetical protein
VVYVEEPKFVWVHGGFQIVKDKGQHLTVTMGSQLSQTDQPSLVVDSPTRSGPVETPAELISLLTEFLA